MAAKTKPPAFIKKKIEKKRAAKLTTKKGKR